MCDFPWPAFAWLPQCLLLTEEALAVPCLEARGGLQGNNIHMTAFPRF